MGIVLKDPNKKNELSVYFRQNGGHIRSISPYKLPEHETAYAMTIHKSQGSEFDDILMVLPENDAPVLTRELIYTGITRARRNLSILSPESVIRLAVSRQIERTSGLRDRLAANG
jgi:exodeoxyribonuclease V alpha subunit